MRTDAMEEKREAPQAPKPDLAAAVRRARVENAERAQALAELREIEMGRLALLETELKAVVGQAPPDVDLFDLTLSPSERPRLFLDMVAFVEMGRDRRTYRFFQDTVHGRMLIAESQLIERIAAAATDYIARRLVERERALAAERGESRQPADSAATAAAALGVARRSETSWGGRMGNAFAFLLMTLGSATLLCLVALGGYVAWTVWLRGLWTRWFGAAPF